jgi:hypothetical protein
LSEVLTGDVGVGGGDGGGGRRLSERGIRSVREGESGEFGGREGTEVAAEVLHASTGEDAEGAALMVVEVLRGGRNSTSVGFLRNGQERAWRKRTTTHPGRRPTELLQHPLPEATHARQTQVRQPRQLLKHLVDGANGEVIAVREVDPFEGGADVKGVEGFVGDVGDLWGKGWVKRIAKWGKRKTHSNETDTLQTREVRGEFEDGKVGEVVAAWRRGEVSSVWRREKGKGGRTGQIDVTKTSARTGDGGDGAIGDTMRIKQVSSENEG